MCYFCPFCPCHQSLFSTQLLRDHFIVPDLEKDFFRSHFASLIQLARFSSLGSMRSPSRSAFFWNKHPVSSPLFFSIPTTTGRSSHSSVPPLHPFGRQRSHIRGHRLRDHRDTEFVGILGHIYICMYLYTCAAPAFPLCKGCRKVTFLWSTTTITGTAAAIPR